jgi:hypothetical protein
MQMLPHKNWIKKKNNITFINDRHITGEIVEVQSYDFTCTRRKKFMGCHKNALHSIDKINEKKKIIILLIIHIIIQYEG